MAKFTALFLLIITIATFAATYNTVTMLLRGELNNDSEVARAETQIVNRPDEKLSRKEVSITAPGVVRRPIDVGARKKKRYFHTAVTSNESPYNKWQCRITYYWYKRFAAMEESEMGGFTRVLHSGVADNMMEEIPTVVVDPLPPGMDKGYVVLNRPWAFVQWLQKATIEEEYILMAEPDHIFVRPLPNLATEFMPAAFPFFYITPREHEALLRRWVPDGPIDSIDPIGNSPCIIKKSELLAIVPTWHNVSLQMKHDPEVDKVFGWVLEMYAYATASRMHNVRHILRKDFMVQPPWDTAVGAAYIIHYTYGMDYNMKGEHMYGKYGEWRFDKRSYSSGAPPKVLALPPKGTPSSVVTLINMFNEAMASFPDWTEGAT